jgi:hypothetical protein
MSRHSPTRAAEGRLYEACLVLALWLRASEASDKARYRHYRVEGELQDTGDATERGEGEDHRQHGRR